MLSRSLDNLFQKTILNKEKVPLAGTFSSFFARSNACVSEPGGRAKKTLLYLIENIPFSFLIVYNIKSEKSKIVTFCNEL